MATEDDVQQSCILGIDMGTTSVKIVLINAVSKNVVYECSKSTDSYIIYNDKFSEQNVQRIVTQLDQCVASIPPDLATQVIGIGVCGQLHGVVCWSSSCTPWIVREKSFSVISHRLSPLYDWQDNRCDSKFLESLPKPDSHLTIHSGYGCCTLFWLIKNSPDYLERLDRSGTIADFIVCMLCDLNLVKMSSQSAASWGYFKTETQEWNREILQSHGFPIHLLPNIAKPATVAGKLKDAWHNIRAGVVVGVALGDLQASVFAVLRNNDCAICQISTSAQLVFVAKNFHPSSGEQKTTSAKIVPYFDEEYLFEGAVLNGGNAVTVFVKNLHQFVSQFQSMDEDTLWRKLIEEARDKDTDLEFSPTFLGERFAPEIRGSITNMKTENFDIPQMFRALCRGVLTNIRNIVSVKALKEKRIVKIIATGSALLRNEVLQMELESQYHPFPVEYTRAADSPFGAALSLLKTLTDELKK